MALPPGPSQHPVVQTLRWIREPIPFMRECRARYGDTFTLRMAGIGTFAFYCAPDAIKQIFTSDSTVLHAGEANAPLGPIVGRNSVLLLDEAPHLRQRKLLLPPFHGERMQAYAEIMREVTDAALDTFPLGTPFAIHTPLQEITLAVILHAVFGVEDGPRFRALAVALTRLLDRAQSPGVLLTGLQRDLPFTPWRKFLALRAETDALIYAEIARRRAEPADVAAKRTDILALLLSATHEDGTRMTDEELRDELVTALVAGHETTASTLAWAFERVLSQPAVYAKAREELEHVVGEGALTPAHLPRLEYLDAVVKETLRMRPILPLVARKTTTAVTIGGHEIPSGAMVAASIYLAHHREENYPEPDAFRPERWIGAKTDPYTWLPFGGGVRRCIGMAFAQYEMKVVLAAMFLRARMRLAQGRAVKVVRRGITLVPEGGTRVVLDARAPRRAGASAVSAPATPTLSA